MALATVTQRPAWLQRHTGASFESKPLASMEMNGWRIVQRAPVTEVTVTSPTHEPRDVGAKALLLDEMPEPKRAAGNREGEPTRGSGIIRRSEPTAASLEEEELRRRIAWCEATYGARRRRDGPSRDAAREERTIARRAAARTPGHDGRLTYRLGWHRGSTDSFFDSGVVIPPSLVSKPQPQGPP